MSSMAVYARIFKLEPDDEYVKKRQQAVATILNVFKGIDPPADALLIAASIAEALHTGVLPRHLAIIAGNALEKQSDSFVQDGEHLQMLVCAMVAALELIQQGEKTDGWAAVDALAAGLWSALSFQPAHADGQVDGLRVNLLNASRNRVIAVGNSSRQRADVPDIGRLSIPEATPAGGRANTAFREATRPMIAALRNNAELDREEIDLLWWVLSDHSETFNSPMASMSDLLKALISGLDGAAILRKLPSNGHRNLILRNVGGTGEFALTELIEEIKDSRETLKANIAKTVVDKTPAVFPLLTALISGQATGPGSEAKYDVRDWGARALLEASILATNSRRPYP